MTPADLEPIVHPFDGRGREALLPVLWEVQTAFGYIGPEAVRLISHTLHVPEADIFGVIGFYSMFLSEPGAKTVIQVCADPACGLAGADELMRNAHHLDLGAGGGVRVEHTTCLGMCELAPAVLVSRQGQRNTVHGRVGNVADILDARPQSRPVAVSGDPRVLLAGVDGAHAETLAQYGDYAALRHALQGMTPQDVIQAVRDSNLVGRGGAAFPTGVKWEGTRAALEARPDAVAYLVCNADESEPGTFKDRVLMENRPHLVLEGMLLAAYAIGARQGYLFIRGEYPEALHRMQTAIAEAEAAGLLGKSILGSDFGFDIEVRRGAGAYICGEETALFEAIEGKRGFPRIKPPYPTTHGLFGQPTVINNVETLCAVPGIVLHGADWFRQWGTEKSAGTKLVSVSGHVGRPGVVEIVPGITLRALLDDYCGGVQGELQAVLMGGAAGTFLRPEDIDLRLTFEDLRAAGSTFGSGAIMVFNATVDLRDVLQRLGRFFKHESCGKCFPCQLGTQRQMEILARAAAPLPGDRERLLDIGRTMTEASLCGLGQTAGSAVMSALAKWPALFELGSLQEQR